MLTDAKKELKWEERQVLRGLKRAATESLEYHQRQIGDMDDRRALMCGSPITPNVFFAVQVFAVKLSIGTVKYRLNKLHKSGHVLKHTTRGGHCCWWPVGLADDLRSKA
jgi:hypothetical protein